MLLKVLIKSLGKKFCDIKRTKVAKISENGLVGIHGIENAKFIM